MFSRGFFDVETIADIKMVQRWHAVVIHLPAVF